jgi:hypothetical protein
MVQTPGEPMLLLAGSLAMGQAPPWQAAIKQALTSTAVTMLNPRRDDWHVSWRQALDDPQFREQVEWELAGLEQADLVGMYFAPTTPSPLPLLELGLTARSGRLIVCCPPGFWRRGNIEVVCARDRIRFASDQAEFVRRIHQPIPDLAR